MKLDISLTYKMASLVVQMVKSLPTVQETWVWSLSWEDPLEKGMATLSSFPAWRIPWTEEPGGLQIHGVAESDMTDWLTLSHLTYKIAILHLHKFTKKKLNHVYKAIYTQIFLTSLFIMDKFVRLLDYLKSWLG